MVDEPFHFAKELARIRERHPIWPGETSVEWSNRTNTLTVQQMQAWEARQRAIAAFYLELHGSRQNRLKKVKDRSR